MRHFLLLASGYWSERSRRVAWLFSLGFLACLVASLLLALEVNRWSKRFFDALEFREVDVVTRSMVELAILVGGTAIVAIATIQCRMRLQVGWRLWLMSGLVERWLQKGADADFALSAAIDNPEARIADDSRIAVELFVDLAGGVINIFLVSTSFIFVLWKVGGAHEIFGLTIPGYLVFAVIAYAGATSLGMYILGRPLVSSVEEKAAAEGDFRFRLTQAREQIAAPSAADGDEINGRDFRRGLHNLASKWMGVILGQTRIVFLSSANNLLAPAVPLLLCAPKYLSGAMTLGDLIQAAAAFVQVQTSLNWLADNALSIANWSASANRVAALEQDLDRRVPASLRMTAIGNP